MVSRSVAELRQNVQMERSDASFCQPLPPGYVAAKTHEPASPCSDDEEVTKPVQEAGNLAKIEIDP